jgi:hypothetical protein
MGNEPDIARINDDAVHSILCYAPLNGLLPKPKRPSLEKSTFRHGEKNDFQDDQEGKSEVPAVGQ